MSIRQSLSRFFSTHAETTEDHHDKNLQTHYYKCMKKDAFSEVHSVLKRMEGITISSVSEERGEISAVIKGKAFIVVTVIMVKPLRTAVDFSVAAEKSLLPTDFGYSRQLIYKMYAQLDKNLSYIGSGLGNSLG